MNIWLVRFTNKDSPIQSARIAAPNVGIVELLIGAMLQQENVITGKHVGILISDAGLIEQDEAKIISVLMRSGEVIIA